MAAEALSLKEFLQGLDCPGMYDTLVDLMHGGHALTFGSGVPYSYYPVPSVALLEPNAGPVEGGTQVVVYGTGLEFGVGPARCRFGDNVTDAVVELHTGVLLCATPESPGRASRAPCCPTQSTTRPQNCGVLAKARVTGSHQQTVPQPCWRDHRRPSPRQATASAGAL